MTRINPFNLFVGSFLPNWLLRLADIQPSSKLVYGRLCQYAGRKGFAYPSLKELADELGLGVRTVQRCIDELEKCGLLEAEQQGNRRTNRYFFLSHPAMKSPVEVDGQNGQSVSGQNDHSGMAKMATPIERESVEENHIPPTPKGEPDGFDEIWKAKWSRGTAPNPRQPAVKAFAAALKRGSSAADILAAVKARVGVDKEGTPYAPQLVTWLNQERWKDASGTVMTVEEIQATEVRLAQSKREHDERMRRLVEEKSAVLRGVNV